MDNRYKLTLITSTNTNFEAFGLFKLRVAELVSRHAGGCTVYNATGWWTPKATETKGEYFDAVDESAFILEVSVPNQGYRGLRLERAVQQAYAQAKADTGASVSWIHCEQSTFNANHFEI